MTIPEKIHPEDIKAAIRKRYRSMAAFERANRLGSRSVTDVLLGRKRPKTAKAISKLLGHDVKVLFPGIYGDSAAAFDSELSDEAHRLCAEAK